MDDETRAAMQAKVDEACMAEYRASVEAELTLPTEARRAAHRVLDVHIAAICCRSCDWYQVDEVSAGVCSILAPPDRFGTFEMAGYNVCDHWEQRVKPS